MSYRLLFLLLFPYIGWAQAPLPITELTMKDGLSQGMIFDILQTSDGFIWFATKDGLNRYDGNRFVVYRHSPADSFSISDNVITKLYEDTQHRFWVRSKSGLDIFDKKLQHFQHVFITTNSKGTENLDEYSDIVEDKQGNIWLSNANEGVYKLQLPANFPEKCPLKAQLTAYVKHSLFPLSEEDEHIYSMYISKNQQIYVASNHHLYQINAHQLNKIDLGVDNLIRIIKEDEKGNLYFFGNKSIIRWNQPQIAQYPHPEQMTMAINSVVEDKEHHIWIAEQNRLWRLNEKGYEFSSLKETSPLTLGKANTTKLYCDKTGNVWVGTNGYGLRKINPKLQHFHHYAAENTVWMIEKDKQENIYIKKYGEIFQLTPPHYQWNETHQPKLIYPNLAFSVLLDQENSHWLLASEDHKIEGKDNLLIQTDINWNPIKKYPIPYAIYQQALLKKDPNGNIWLSVVGAKVLRFRPSSGELTPFDYSHLFKENLPTTLMLYFDVNHQLWIATNKGIIKGIPNSDSYTFQHYQNQANNPFSLPNNVISSFCDDPLQPQQFIWIGTKGGGLVKMEKSTGKCQIFTEKQGLPNAVVYGILPDEEGDLWISTNNGLAKLNSKTIQFQPFTQADGLQDNEFNTQAFSKSPKGELCFGGINGFNIFYPKEIVVNQIKPQIAIVDLKVNNQTISVGDSTQLLALSLQTPQTLSLSYQQNYLSISFAALDFTTPSKHQFKYMLEGIDQDWIYCGNQSTASYTALPPGKYTFKVFGCNGDGTWSQEPAILTFEIRPPFWRTYWAYILYLLAAAAAVYQFYQYQLRRVQLHNKLQYEQRETERLLALDELKNRFFSNVTHEFRTPLTLILEPARQLLKELTDNSALQKASIIESNSQKLLQLVNQLLDLSKIESGSMKVELQHGDLIEVIQPIYRSFLSLTQKKEIQFTWNYPHNLPTIAFDRDKIEKILHNLLSNALKFTPKQGEIHLTTTIHQHNLCIVVKDSGVGISNENLQKIFQRFYQADNTITRKSEGSGVGLALVKELVDLLNGRIEVESEIEKGTTFSIILPITNNIAQNITTSKPEISEFQSFTDIDFRGEESLISTQKGLILLVEDNSDMRFFIKQSVEAKGYKVMEAENGLAGVEKAFELIPDLIISDVMMPEKDGYDLTRTLKTDIRTSHIPIILLTAKSSLDSKLIGLEVGADAYIGKPFHTEELLIRIERLIELRKILQSKYFPSQGNSSTLMVTDEAETDNHEPATSGKTNVLVLSQLDKKFLAHIHEIIEQNLDNEELSVNDFTDQLFLSRSQLHRKIVALTNQSISEFIRNYRLDKAKTLLEQKTGNISEIAYQVGFKDAKYFSTTFKKRFGISPSEI